MEEVITWDAKSTPMIYCQPILACPQGIRQGLQTSDKGDTQTI